MTTIEYMKKQIVKHTISLEKIQSRSGVTETEIANLKLKIGYYEDAVKALEKMG